MPYVEEINDPERLESHRLRWSALLAQTPGRSFFHSLDWLLAYWKCYGAGQKLRVLIVSSGGETIGIVPLTVRRETTRLGALRVLTYPLHDWGSFYGPIGHQPAATLTAAMLHLRATRRDWDLLDLRWIDEETDRGRSRRAMTAAGFSVRSSVWDATCLVDLPSTWEEYFARLSSKVRSNIRRAERRLAEQGAAAFERYRPLGASQGQDAPRWDLYEQCVDLARRSWQGSSDNGTTLSHPQVACFFRETHLLAARSGALDLALLRLDGRSIAYAYNYHACGSVFGLRTGYAPEFAECGAGLVLLAWMFRDSIARGDRRLDMGVAAKETKRRWAPRWAPLGRLTHYAAGSPRAQLLGWKHRLSDRRPPIENPARANYHETQLQEHSGKTKASDAACKFS